MDVHDATMRYILRMLTASDKDCRSTIPQPIIKTSWIRSTALHRSLHLSASLCSSLPLFAPPPPPLSLPSPPSPPSLVLSFSLSPPLSSRTLPLSELLSLSLPPLLSLRTLGKPQPSQPRPLRAHSCAPPHAGPRQRSSAPPSISEHYLISCANTCNS